MREQKSKLKEQRKLHINVFLIPRSELSAKTKFAQGSFLARFVYFDVLQLKINFIYLITGYKMELRT